MQKRLAYPHTYVKGIIPKKKFGKICKVESSTLEIKGIFLSRLARNLQKPRHPRVLQGSDRRAGEAARLGYAA
jgi:hypothetical protein